MPANTRLEEIGSAAAGIAHDLNNQLTLILNHLAFRDVESAKIAAQRCSELTESLLAYSSGRSLLLRRLDSEAFIDGFLKELRLPQAPVLPALRPAVKTQAPIQCSAVQSLPGAGCQ